MPLDATIQEMVEVFKETHLPIHVTNNRGVSPEVSISKDSLEIPLVTLD